MMPWTKRTAAHTGSILLHGPSRRPEHLSFLEPRGLSVENVRHTQDGGFTLDLRHPTWGKATVASFGDNPLPPPDLIELDPRLDAEEKRAARSAGSSLALRLEPRTGNLLADRKDLLRFLHALMDAGGVGAIDHGAQAMWSRRGLEDELSHDAELDIDAVYTLHMIYDPDEHAAEGSDPPAYWLHSHGLSDLGFWELDVLDPADDLRGHGHDLLRALAFAIVEGTFAPGSAPHELASPGGSVRAVRVRDFLAQAPASEHRKYRESVDDEHTEGHAVICDPERSGLLSRLFRRGTTRASRWLRGPFPEEILIGFSTAATDLMARRARQMVPVLRQVFEETRDLELPALVKIGYPTDHGDPDHREHLWFEVQGFPAEGKVDATLLNQPFDVAHLEQGARGLHALDMLSDWTIMSPVGSVSPRQTLALRSLRENRDAIVRALREARESSD